MNNKIYDADYIVVDEIIEDAQEELKSTNTYIIALNIPRLKGLLNEQLKNKGYNFIAEDNTGFDGEYSRVQTRYTISL